MYFLCRRKVNRVIRETATRLELKEIIKEMEEEVEHLQITNRGKDAILENLTEEVSELKRECQELEQKQSTAKNSAVPGELLDLKKKLEEEQHRCKSLQEKLEKLSKTKKVDLDSFDTIEVLKAEKKELAIQVEDLMLDLQKSKSRAEDMEGKLKVFTRNKDDLNSNNVQLRESLDKSEEVIEELSKKLKTSETKEKEVRKKYEEAKQEMERVSNVNQQLKREVRLRARIVDGNAIGFIASHYPGEFKQYLFHTFSLIRLMKIETNWLRLILVRVM